MLGISLDIGTSGIRAHGIDLASKRILSTAVTDSHPVPGASAMDHITFAMRMGVGVAHNMMVSVINDLIEGLDINLRMVQRIGVCGNPVQLSILQNMRVDDLAFTGEKARRIRGITPQDRNARTVCAAEVGLKVPDRAQLIVPPAVRNDIGADAVAMIMQSGFLNGKGNRMITDFGTNAEIALKCGDDIFTGSSATSPTIEGRYMRNGMLPLPGAISDMEYEFHWMCRVLDRDLTCKDGDVIDLPTHTLISEGRMHRRAKGITGSGMIGLLYAAIRSNVWRKAKLNMPKGRIELQDGLFVTSKDMLEMCKAIGAVRAAHFSLIENAGIGFDEMGTMYMSGATGTYTDPRKARSLGLIPPLCREVHQVGNTSLLMADAIVLDPESVDEMRSVADGMKAKNIVFAADEVFEQVYVQELAYWEEGMSMRMYNENLELAGIQRLPEPGGPLNIHRKVERDIPDLGKNGLRTVTGKDTALTGRFEGCTGCRKCQRGCPESALKVDTYRTVRVRGENCLGASCYKCQYRCPEKVFRFEELRLEEPARVK